MAKYTLSSPLTPPPIFYSTSSWSYSSSSSSTNTTTFPFSLLCRVCQVSKTGRSVQMEDSTIWTWHACSQKVFWEGQSLYQSIMCRSRVSKLALMLLFFLALIHQKRRHIDSITFIINCENLSFKRNFHWPSKYGRIIPVAWKCLVIIAIFFYCGEKCTQQQ